MHGYRPGALFIVGALALIAVACSPAPQSGSQETASETASAPPPDTAVEPRPAKAPAEPETQVADIEPAAGPPDAPSAPGSSVPPVYTEAPAPSAPPPMTNGEGAPPPIPLDGAPMPPAAAADPTPAPAPAAPAASPPAAANGDGPGAPPPLRNGHSGSKVLSYFQKSRTQIDTKRAFGFVLMPRAAVTAEDKRVQKDFCATVLATMDFMTPSAVAASAPVDVLATYWPVVGSRESYEIKQAFTERNCDDLIAWYDFALARTLATQAGVAELSGPLLITWPSQGVDGDRARDPLIVDFSKANHERAAKALQYWFRQVKSRPELWTNRIREGTIRAELADAVNDTAGVLLTVMSGKWESFTVVASASP